MTEDIKQPAALAAAEGEYARIARQIEIAKQKGDKPATIKQMTRELAAARRRVIRFSQNRAGSNG